MIIFILFVLMILVGVAVVAGISVFYNARLDVRAVEAEILMQRVTSCAADHDLFADLSLEECGIFPAALSGHLVYLARSDGTELFLGTYDYRTQCELEGLKGRVDAPVCLSRTIVTPYGTYEVITASSQTGRRGLA